MTPAWVARLVSPDLRYKIRRCPALTSEVKVAFAFVLRAVSRLTARNVLKPATSTVLLGGRRRLSLQRGRSIFSHLAASRLTPQLYYSTSQMDDAIVYQPYTGEGDLAEIMALIDAELSEPYVIYTYRYFLHNW